MSSGINHHILSVLVQNRPGVLARVSNLFARRGYNIYSLAVAPTDDERFSRITIVVDVESAPLEQIVKQLNKLINVVKITELDPRRAVERELLATFLRGKGGVVLCPARALNGAAFRRAWMEPLLTGRMLLLSMLEADLRRPTAALAMRRNRLVAAVSQRVLLLHAAPGGQLWHLAREVTAWGLPLECLQHRANGDLQLLGASTIRPRAPSAAEPWSSESGPSGEAA